MIDTTSNITAEAITAEAIEKHEMKYAPVVAAVAAAVVTDHELIAADLRAENDRLKASLAAVRLGTTPSDGSNNGKPLISAARFRAEVGLSSLRGMPVNQKLEGIGLDPATVSVDHLERLFCLGNDGVAAAELMRASPKRYRQLREAADLLGIYGSRPSSKR
jgi:hypothetical protein